LSRLAIGLVPDRPDIINGIGALLSIKILVLNLIVVISGKMLQRKMGMSGH